MNYDEIISVIRPNVGRRVRVTWPNGTQRTGLVGLWREYPTLGAYQSGDHYIGGNLIGGEYDGAIRVEVMRPNGRYQMIAG